MTTSIDQTASATALAEGLRACAPGWNITVRDHDRGMDIDLQHRAFDFAGASLFLHVDPYRHRGRVVISGVYPQMTDGRNRVAAITVALTRSPEAIVKEITRRFLPEYLLSYAAALEAKAKQDAYQNKKRAALQELADILGVAVHDRQEQAYYYQREPYTRVEVKDTSGGTANLNITVPQDLARQILRLIVAGSTPSSIEMTS